MRLTLSHNVAGFFASQLKASSFVSKSLGVSFKTFHQPATPLSSPVKGVVAIERGFAGK